MKPTSQQQNQPGPSQPPPGPNVPCLTIGHYIFGKSLGKGTFGKVKLATHTLTNEKVAVKILEKDKIKDKKDVERITREIKILKKVRHPNVIQLYEIIETESELFLFMEFCQNGELFDYIVAHQRLTEKQACKFFQDMIAGIEYSHQSGVCHRDLKPENLLLDYDKTLKIVDFGLSNMYEGDELLKTACGSPCYAAPEMIAGKKYRGLKSDIWSSGVVLFAMVCGYLPFEDPKTSNLYKKILAADYQIPKFISSECADLLSKILNTNPDTRYSIEDIRAHPWYKLNKERRMCGLFPGKEKMPYNEQIFKIMMDQHPNFENEYAVRCIEANRHNYITATYHLLHKKHMRHNKAVSDYPQLVAGSIDRAHQPSRAQRQLRQEEESTQNSRRVQSIVGGGGRGTGQDLNQTLPAYYYPGGLQTVQPGEELTSLNSDGGQEISAQKKYKMQLQAEINKLKQKYNSSAQKDDSNPPKASPIQTIQPINLNNESMLVQANEIISPKIQASNRTYEETTISKNGSQTNPSNQITSSQASNQYTIGIASKNSKQQSATTTESTNGSSSLNDYQRHLNTIHHQRFKSTTMQGGVSEQPMINHYQPKLKYNVASINQYAKQAMVSTKYNFNSRPGGDSSKQNTGGVMSGIRQSTASSNVNKSVIGNSHFSTIDQIDLNNQNSNKLNQTITQYVAQSIPDNSRIPPRDQSGNSKRGKSTTLDASPDPLSHKVGGRASITQSLNMSQIVGNTNNTVLMNQFNNTSALNQTQDYSYPIGIIPGNTGGPKNIGVRNTVKLNDLRLQTAADFSNFKSMNNSSQNKHAINTGLDFFMRQQKSTITNGSSSSQKPTPQMNSTKPSVRYSGGAGGSIPPTGQRQMTQSPKTVHGKVANTSLDNPLNITELYKQYAKKPPVGNMGPGMKPGTGGHYRAISMLEQGQMTIGQNKTGRTTAPGYNSNQRKQSTDGSNGVMQSNAMMHGQPNKTIYARNY